MTAALVILAALGTVSAPPEDAPPKQIERVVDMVVAEVDTTVITLSELIAETRTVLLRQYGPERARAVNLTPELLRAVLRAIVSRELLLAEARRLQLRAVPQSDVAAAAQLIRDKFATHGEYVRFMERVGFTVPPHPRDGASVAVPAVLEAMLRAERQVERFIALRIRPAVVVRSREVEQCFEVNRAFLGNRPLEEVRGLIERTLRDERAEKTLVDLIHQLEGKAVIRFAPDFVPDPFEGDEDEDGIGLRCPSRVTR